MTYAWDPRKASANLEKHGVDFADAALALEDDRAMTAEDNATEGERRFVRIISARRANKREQRHYESSS